MRTLKQLEKLVQNIDFRNIDFTNHIQVVNIIKQVFSISKDLTSNDFINSFKAFDILTLNNLLETFTSENLAHFEAVRILTILYNVKYDVYKSDYKIFYKLDTEHIIAFLQAI